MTDYEHTQALRDAQDALVTLRHRARKLHWISGGKGYDGMGARESEQLRTKLDEAGFWLGALSRSMNAGGERAKTLGYGTEGEDDVTAFVQDMGACVDCPHSEGCPIGTCEIQDGAA